ncbi:EAL domain-containing protein [Chryseomicrobium imtechense]
MRDVPPILQGHGGIQSMLDAPIMMSTGIGGVLCCETLSKRHWSELDQTLVGTLADMVAFLYERIYRIETEERMKHLAYVDQTTGLMNQNGFEQTVASILTNSEDGKLIYLVIDQFVTIQEVLGFDGGDQVLQQIADRLTALFPNPSHVARLAMDHFVLFVPSFLATPLDDLLIQLKKPYIIKGQEVYVSYSYGSATYPIHGTSVKECLQNAQIALSYGKKLSTQSISSLYNPFMKEASQILFDTEFNLRKGLDMQQFSLYYQPQVNARTGEVEGFEALIRWQHPEKGIIPPIDFIQHAESTGLILPIGEWVIDRVFYQLEQWRDQGIDQCSISINVSPRHFLHEKLIPHLELCLLKYNVKSSDVIIEITENVAMGDYLAAQSRIAELHALGFKISIDDFGTGFSAFIYLQHFTIDEIKIDRQFILDIESNKKSLGIVKSILDLANLLDLRVVVEGVETENQLHLLSQLGCETIQGYLYSRPLDTNQLKTWLHERSAH